MIKLQILLDDILGSYYLAEVAAGLAVNAIALDTPDSIYLLSASLQRIGMTPTTTAKKRAIAHQIALTNCLLRRE
jgi:hypothetical protein